MGENLPVKGKGTALTRESENPASYIQAATSDNTRRAYQTDIDTYQAQGGVLPAKSTDIEAYLKKFASHYNPRSLQRRLTALRQWHHLKQLPDPTDHPSIKKTLRGICRVHGRPKVQAAALRLTELDALITRLGVKNTLHAVRNQALLVVGFFGAFRASELVSLTWEQIHFVSGGMIITLPRSKTDQTGEGTEVVIPVTTEKRCPVRHLLAWREKSTQKTGPVFRRLSKKDRVLALGISAVYWNRLMKALAQDAKLPNATLISSHSLRRGFATEAARLGAPLPAIKRHGRWRSTEVVLEYIEAGRQFHDSAVNALFDAS